MGTEEIPEEWLELQFILHDGDHFTVDAEKVTMKYTKSDHEFRKDKVKTWHLQDGELEREITQDEVYSCMTRVKDDYRDNAKALEEWVEASETVEEDE